MDKVVYCKFNIEGFHYWEGAIKTTEKYLSNMHRHIFYFKCGVGVEGDDREIEFIKLRREIKQFLVNNYGLPCNFDTLSCEMIAKHIIMFLKSKYGDRHYVIDVSEDNENGALITDG